MYIYGIHPVEELLSGAPEKIRELIFEDPEAAKFADIRALAERRGLAFRGADARELDRVAEGGNHQGVAARTTPFEYDSMENILQLTAAEKRACVLLLDQVQDPQNLGAILRSAAAMGVTAVFIPKHRAAGITPAVVRASAGQALKVRVALVTNIARAIDKLKDNGWWAAGSVLGQSSTPPWQVDFDMKVALVMGSEHQGLRRLVAKKCDFHLEIPMYSAVESLNVASAASILLYEIRRQWAQK